MRLKDIRILSYKMFMRENKRICYSPLSNLRRLGFMCVIQQGVELRKRSEEIIQEFIAAGKADECHEEYVYWRTADSENMPFLHVYAK